MITRLSLDNFKCFNKEQIFDLSQFNILTGYNGRGKSSVFQALLLLAQSKAKHRDVQTLDVNGDFIKLGLFEELTSIVDDPEIRIGLRTNLKDAESVELGYTEKSERKGNISSLIINGVNYFDHGRSLDSSTENDSPNVSAQLLSYPGTFDQIFDNCYYISADRIGPTFYEEKTDVEDINPIGTKGEHRLNFLTKNKSLEKIVNEELAWIMDGDSITIEGGKKNQNVLKLQFHHPNTNKAISAVNTGFGYSYILSILLVVLSIEKGCLFIENPEAHLHPMAQSRLMQIVCNLATKKEVQVFVETHSEHIVNAVRLNCLKSECPIEVDDVRLFFFDKDYSIQNLILDGNAQISNWPKGFFDQQEIDIAEILQRGLFKE